MKAITKLLTIVFLIILVSCNKNELIEPSELSSSQGNIGIAFERATVPDDVSIIRATLSRDGFPSIVREISVQDTNTTILYIDNIPIGNWNLLVEAINNNNSVTYRGEANIEVKENITTFMTLILSPSNNNTGSIYITIIWGTEWANYYYNPILSGQTSEYNPFGVAQPFVLKENGMYKMWYNGLSHDGIAYVLYATSKNGKEWETYGNTPVLFQGDYGDWDSGRAGPGPVIKINDLYYLYYHSYEMGYGRGGIGLATSPDGLNWTKYPAPILKGEDWDYYLMATSIVNHDDKYYLYYTSYGTDYRIGLAISSDGIHWEKYSDSPIIVPDLPWEQNSVGYPSVILENGIFKMVYVSINSSGSFFSSATSVDGINWMKESQPFFSDNNVTSSFKVIHYPFFMVDDTEYKLYYTGYDYQDILHICLATKEK